MKATIKRVITNEGKSLIKVFAGDSILSTEAFYFTDEQTEKESMDKAFILAKKIEKVVAEETVIYETGVTAIDYFIASHMTDEQLADHLKNVI